MVLASDIVFLHRGEASGKPKLMDFRERYGSNLTLEGNSTEGNYFWDIAWVHIHVVICHQLYPPKDAVNSVIYTNFNAITQLCLCKRSGKLWNLIRSLRDDIKVI